MRIERIKNTHDFLEWCLDQVGHVAIVVIVALPVLWWGAHGVLATGIAVLSIREWEQWRRKSDIKKLADRMLPWYLRHLDRALDVLIGTGIAWWVLS